MTSSVTIFGAKHLLGETSTVLAEDYGCEANWYIGGQSLRSFDVTWSLGDRLQGEFVAIEAPSRCASGRFGNCLHVRAYRRMPSPMFMWGGVLSEAA